MYTFLRSVRILFDFIEILIIVRIFANIFRIPTNNIFGKVLYELTEPIMAPARGLLEKIGLNKGFIDFSPWVAIIILRLIYTLILNLVN